MGNNISADLHVDIRNNKITSLTVYNSLKGQILQCVWLLISGLTVHYILFKSLLYAFLLLFFVVRLAGNPLCSGDSLLSGMTPCTGPLTEPPPEPPSLDDVQCANPFVETIVFRAPYFGEVTNYLSDLRGSLESNLSRCTPNRLGLVPSNLDTYLHVDIRACPVNKKRFSYSQVLNCFNLTLQNYKPPEIFGPYYVKAHPYAFHDKSNWFSSPVMFFDATKWTRADA